MLRIEGEVLAPGELSFADLAALPEQVADIGVLLPGRRGGGVRLGALLERVGVGERATHASIVASDGSFSASVPLAALRQAVLAYRLGGEPLPDEHGGPLRCYIPDAAACGIAPGDACANVKRVGTIRLSRGAEPDSRQRRG
jgi:DMSO/TMAO reductase YedYZ molybdopterin-dependent catalytic subunit